MVREMSALTNHSSRLIPSDVCSSHCAPTGNDEAFLQEGLDTGRRGGGALSAISEFSVSSGSNTAGAVTLSVTGECAEYIYDAFLL